MRLGLLGQHLGLGGEFLGGLGEKVLGQARNVLAALRQPGQMNANHVEPVEQILTEAPFRHQLFQVLVRRGNDPHIHLDRHVPADPVEFAIRQHAQQARLGIGGHVADLVQEQRAAIGLLETPATLGGSAGERALFVAEQLGFHQILGDRGHVERDERVPATRAVLVQRLGDALLAGARFAIDQHRDVRLRQPADRPEHLLHRRRFTDDLGGQTLRHRRGRTPLAGVRHPAPNQRQRIVDIERLGQVFERAPLIGRHGTVQVGVRRHHDHGKVGMHLADFCHQIEPVEPRHANVGQQHVRRVAFDRLERGIGPLEGLHFQVRLCQCPFQNPANRTIVIDDRDTSDFSHGSSPAER